MAGDWLKMRTRLAEERAVMLICELTGLDQFAVVGRLHAFWSWAGEHTSNGRVTDVTLKTVDRVTSHDGFGAAMVSAKWLETPPEGGIVIPRWKEHNGKAAKARYLASLRQVKKRAKMSRAQRDGQRDATVTSHATREEKSREDIDTPNGVSGNGKKAGRFVAPTLAEVSAYCRERGNRIDPEAFLAHYTANGWKQSNGNAIKNWQSTVITWEKRDANHKAGNNSGSSGAAPQPASRVAVPPGALDKFNIGSPASAGGSAGSLFGSG